MKNNFLALVIFLPLLLGGCGYNVKAIKSFESSTNSLTTSFKEMTQATETRCYTTFRAFASIQPKNDDYRRINQAAESGCKQFVEENKTTEMIADVISGYADALAKVVGVEPNYLDDENSSLEKAAAELKDRKETPEFKKEDLSAVSKLANTIAKVYTTYKVKKESVALIQRNKALVNANVEKMSLYATRIYEDQMRLEQAVLQSVLDDLIKASKLPKGAATGSVVPHRLAQADYVKALDYVGDGKTPGKGKEVSEKFTQACKALINANNELAEKFQTLSEEAQLKEVLAFAKDARAVRDSLNTLRK
ncbi:hypothetical protein [Pseudomonas sp. NPDC096950]|uniref:hypothetical protein n=1 Tax=Pseudomonas sp. NPDC096950 TaxID=3364485 RepID=UPI00383B564B